MPTPKPETSHAEANAIKLLRVKGYSIIEPSRGSHIKPADQCEYPLRDGDLGDCCTNSTRRNRKTSQGTMWLCSDHFSRPETELFDERVG